MWFEQRGIGLRGGREAGLGGRRVPGLERLDAGVEQPGGLAAPTGGGVQKLDRDRLVGPRPRPSAGC